LFGGWELFAGTTCIGRARRTVFARKNVERTLEDRKAYRWCADAHKTARHVTSNALLYRWLAAALSFGLRSWRWPGGLARVSRST